MLINHQLKIETVPKNLNKKDLYEILVKYGRIVEIVKENDYFVVTFVSHELKQKLAN